MFIQTKNISFLSIWNIESSSLSNSIPLLFTSLRSNQTSPYHMIIIDIQADCLIMLKTYGFLDRHSCECFACVWNHLYFWISSLLFLFFFPVWWADFQSRKGREEGLLCFFFFGWNKNHIEWLNNHIKWICVKTVLTSDYNVMTSDQSDQDSAPFSPVVSKRGFAIGSIVRKAASVASVAAKHAYAAAAATTTSDDEMLPLKCCLMSISLPWEHIAYDLLFKVSLQFT